MARVVDKDQKKRDIALACKDMVLSNCIDTLTIAALAKAANIGKGTFYEYFNSKEEIVFEIVTIMLHQHHHKLKEQIEKVQATREKIKVFSEFFYNKEDHELRELYKKFTSISLIKSTPEMQEFLTNTLLSYYNWFEAIIQEGIDKGELRKESVKLAKGVFVVGKGMFVIHNTTTAIQDLEYEFNLFINSLFDILEVQ